MGNVQSTSKIGDSYDYSFNGFLFDVAPWRTSSVFLNHVAEYLARGLRSIIFRLSSLFTAFTEFLLSPDLLYIGFFCFDFCYIFLFCGYVC